MARWPSMEKEYPTLKALRRGEVVDLGGVLVKMDEGGICPGDLYVAEGSTGPHLLTAERIKYVEEFAGDNRVDIVFPTNLDYPFDGYQCVRVCEA